MVQNVQIFYTFMLFSIKNDTFVPIFCIKPYDLKKLGIFIP